MTDTAIQIKNSIVIIRDKPVILAHDLAIFFETETKSINLYRKRNADKFTEDYAFQLTLEDWERMRLQNETSNKSRGGSRYLPWAYTEHGVAMMSMGMKSENAVRLSKVIIDTFVDYRRGTLPSHPVIAGPKAIAHRRSLQEKIYQHIEQLLDAPLPASEGQTVRDELGTIATKSLAHIKAVMDRPGLTNEKISADVTKVLAEAEKLYAETRKLHAEADSQILQNYRQRIEFIRDLREMAQQLERDDWLGIFEEGFGTVQID